MTRGYQKRMVLGAVLLVALTLRVWPLSFPADSHPDEENSVARALRMGRDGLNPQWYRYPPLYFYILFATFGGRYAVERVIGLVDSPEHFAEQYFVAPLSFFIQARVVSALFGVLAVWALYFLARRLSFSSRAAAGAAFVLAVSPLLVRLSHFSFTDGPPFLPFLLSLAMAAQLLKDGGKSCAFWSGFLAGLAAALKYPAGIAIVGLIGAAFSRRGNNSAGRLILCGLLGLGAGFLFVCPWAMLNFSAFWQDIAFVGEHMSHTLGDLPRSRGYIPYVLQYLPEALGWPFYLTGILGLTLWLRRNWRSAAIVGGPALAYWLIMGMAQYHYAKFSLPMLPVFALGVAWLLDRPSWQDRWKGAFAAVCLLLFAIPPLSHSLSWNLQLSLPDTRALATQWIERNVSPGVRVLSQSYGPRLAYTPERAREIAESVFALDLESGQKFSFLASHPPLGRPGFHVIGIPVYKGSHGFSGLEDTWYDAGKVNAERIEWIVLSSSVYGRYLGRKTFPRQVAFHIWLDQCWQEAARFSSHEPPLTVPILSQKGRLGPTLRVLKRIVPPPVGCQQL